MNNDTKYVSAIIVVILLLTRLPMKRGERPTVLAYYESNKVLGYPTAIFDCVVGSGSYIGVIILFSAMGLLHLIHFSSLSLVLLFYS